MLAIAIFVHCYCTWILSLATVHYINTSVQVYTFSMALHTCACLLFVCFPFSVCALSIRLFVCAHISTVLESTICFFSGQIKKCISQLLPCASIHLTEIVYDFGCVHFFPTSRSLHWFTLQYPPWDHLGGFSHVCPLFSSVAINNVVQSKSWTMFVCKFSWCSHPHQSSAFWKIWKVVRL